MHEILTCYVTATRYDTTWYKAWHTWALANFAVLGHLEPLPENRFADIPPDNLAAHAVQAVEGFFASIALRGEDALQDILRLLTLWFKFGAHDDVCHAMEANFSKVEIDTWLEVIPQVSY